MATHFSTQAGGNPSGSRGVAADTADRELVVSRNIESPRERVFEAFTSRQHLAQWFGPDGFRLTTHALDFSVGGGWVFVIQGPGGMSHANYIRWREITPERIVFEHGQRAGDPKLFEATVTFAERGAGTEVTVQGIFNTQELRDRMVRQFHAIEGTQQALGRLAAYAAQLSKQGT